MPTPVNANMKYENEDECNKRDIWVGAGHSPKPAAHSSSLLPSVHHTLTRRAPGTRPPEGSRRGERRHQHQRGESARERRRGRRGARRGKIGSSKGKGKGECEEKGSKEKLS